MSQAQPQPPDHLPSDLAADEAEVAALFEALDRVPPAALGPRVVEAFRPAPRAGFRVPRGPFGLVGAGLLLLAVGAVVWVSLAARDAQVQAAQPRGAPSDLVEDPRVPLYRGLETFQSLDVGRPDADDPVAACREER